MNMKQNTLSILAWLLAAGITQAAVLNDFQFDDTAGTTIGNTDNTGTDPLDAPFSNDDSDVTTTGTGFLSVEKTSGSYFGPVDVTDITSGTTFVRLDIESWDLDSSTGHRVGFGFRDAGSDFLQVRLNHTGVGTMELEYRAGNAGGFTDITTFGDTKSDGLSILIGLDTTADTMDIYYMQTLGVWIQAVDGASSGDVGDVAELRTTFNNGDFTSGGDSFIIDRLYHTGDTIDAFLTVPEPSSMALILSGLVLVGSVRRCRVKR